MATFNQKGMTLIGALVAAAIAGFIALVVATMMSDTIKLEKRTERRYATIQSLQDLRRFLSLPVSCKCNFANPGGPVWFDTSTATIPAVNVAGIRKYTAADCSTSTNILTAGGDVPGQTGLKVNTIQLVNPRLLDSNMVNTDLVITFTSSGDMTPPRPAILPNMIFGTSVSGATLQVSDCVSADSAPSSTPSGGGAATDPPKICGTGKFCFNGKTVQFKNGTGNAVATTLVSVSGNNYRLMFTTASGRNALYDMTDTGSGLTYTVPTGWKGQLCYSHGDPTCLLFPYFGNPDYNCGSAIFWSGDYNGNTTGTATSCP